MPLSNDITRCCDGLCAERHDCRRFIERFAMPVGHLADTLYSPDDTGDCTNRLPLEGA